MRAKRPSEDDGLALAWIGSDAPGWAPIAHLVELAARLLPARVEVLAPGAGARWRVWRRRVLDAPRGGRGGRLYLGRTPGEIRDVVGAPGFDAPAAFRAVWVIDSFWTERLPRGLLSNFDLVAYTQKGVAGTYAQAFGGPTLFLGWGSDALDAGTPGGARDIDVLRVGRQPAAWDDDGRSAAALAARGLVFHGRPPFGDTPAAQQATIMSFYRRSRFVVAHSNLLGGGGYTHPSAEYLTGRWTDAVAAGAVVAGVQPRGDAGFGELLWDGAVLDFDTADLERNADALADAVRAWTPEVARRNHVLALRRLDWRWRLQALARALALEAPALDADILRLERAIEERGRAG